LPWLLLSRPAAGQVFGFIIGDSFTICQPLLIGHLLYFGAYNWEKSNKKQPLFHFLAHLN